MPLQDSDRKKLWALAGGRCSRCFRQHGSEVPLQEAHILARSPGGPRGKSGRAEGKDTYDNYVLLCANCHHGEIDAKPDDWPPERIRQMKAEHEKKVRELGEEPYTLAGSINVRGIVADDVAGARIKKFTRIAPGTTVNVEDVQARRVTGVEIGGE